MADCAEKGLEMRTLSAKVVADWTKDLTLSEVILVQRARVVNLQSEVENKKPELRQKSLESLEEAEVKLESLEALLREAIIAHTAEVEKLRKDNAARSTINEAKERLEPLRLSRCSQSASPRRGLLP